MLATSNISRSTLLQLFDNSSELVFIYNTAGKTVYCNKAAYDSGSVLLERLPGSLPLNSGNDEIVDNLNGISHTLRYRHSQLLSETGEDLQALICSDITELRKTSNSLSRERSLHEEKTRAMDALNSVTVELINRQDISALLQHVAENTGSITAADYSYVAMVHESGDYLETVAASHDPAKLRNITHRQGEGIGGETWRIGESIVTTDYQSYEKRLPTLTHARQACATPIKIDGKVVGVIGVMYISYKVSAADQIALLEKLAQLVSVAIENAKLHETTKTELASAQAISDLSRSIYGTTNLEELLNKVCVTMVRAFNASKAHVYQCQTDQLLEPLVAWEENNGEILPATQADSRIASGSIAAWCVKHKESAFVPRGIDDKRESVEVHKVRKLMRLGSTICVPLVHNENCWGTLYAHRRIEQADFTDYEIRMFSIIANQTSIALHRQSLLEAIQYRAFYDSLTGLPNRLTFEKNLSNAIQHDTNQDKTVAVLSIDLDGFKNVNDTLGHRIGDELLKQVATRLNYYLKTSDTLARLGGDEFAIILPDLIESQALAMAIRLIKRLDDTFTIDKASVNIGASIGLSFYPDHAKEASELVKNADLAMRAAKGNGKGGTAVYSPLFAERHAQRLQLEQDIKHAINEGQFQLYYQPKVSCAGGTVEGVEALIRWKHPSRGFVSPAEFIPVAEDSGLIEEVGTWVIDEACRQGSEFHQAGLDVSIAVNISARQFSKDNFVTKVLGLLEKHKFPYQKLELEVTESVVMKDIALVVDRLEHLRGKGIKIAIDDFGTGYSSLQYLADLPLDVLKIDKAFIDKLDGTAESTSLIRAIVQLAKSFGLTTVAEGVETVQQFYRVRQIGCHYVQGYFFSKAVPANALIETIQCIHSRENLNNVA